MKTRFRFLVLALLLPGLGLVPSRTHSKISPPAAVLTSCKGVVNIVRPGGANAPATFGLPLHDGDEVKTGSGGEAEIMFSAGNWVQIGQNSSMKIKERASGTSAGAAKEDPKGVEGGNGGNFEVVQSFLKLKSAEGSSAIGALRAGDKASSLTASSPCQTKVRTSQPTFKWQIEDPSAELRLSVYGQSGVLWHTDFTNKTSLEYPKDAPALAPGVSYSWTLETTDPLVSPPLRTPAAFFEVIAPAEAKTLDTDLSQLDANKPGPVTYHLMRASLYFDRGLVDEAIVETETALAADPENASLHAILGRLYAETGRTKDAINEMNKAQQ